MLKRSNNKVKTTSWHKSGKWYNKLVGSDGHYYHSHVILPGVLRLLQLDNASSVLDVGCGQGILARQLPKNIYYQGIDLAGSLIKAAQEQDKNPLHHYAVADAAKPFPLAKKDFTRAVIILALQNMEFPDKALKNVGSHLRAGGRMVIVLNHPGFRVPRQSGWGISENQQQHRWVMRYMTPLAIPIEMHPGKRASEQTMSFHLPLSAYSNYLFQAGFMIEKIEEWVSDKKNQPGPHAKREDVARGEIPLFMAIVCKKN